MRDDIHQLLGHDNDFADGRIRKKPLYVLLIFSHRLNFSIVCRGGHADFPSYLTIDLYHDLQLVAAQSSIVDLGPQAFSECFACQCLPQVLAEVWRDGPEQLQHCAQALVDDSSLGNPRRVTVGFEQNRLAMLLAVLHRHGGIQVGDQDVFANVVGGVRVMETSADLALLLAVVSSLRSRPLPRDWVVFGEVGLSGEIRPVASGQERLA